MAGGTWVAGSVAVLVKPVLNNFQKDIRSQLSSSGMESVGRDIGNDIANPIVDQATEGSREASRRIKGNLADAGKGQKFNLMKPLSAEGASAGKAFVQKFNGALKTGLKIGAVGALLGGGVLLKDSVAEASDLEQNLGATETVYGEFFDSVVGKSKTAATEYGMSQNEFLKNSNLMGSLLKNQGVPMDQLSGKTTELIGLASDLSATYGGTSAEAVEALSAAYKGEYDSLEKYGISINDNVLNQKALEMGITKTNGAYTAEQKQLLTSAVIMDQTKDAQGAFAKESDTLAHKQQVAAAQFANLKATIGEAFLPVLSTLMGVVSEDIIPAFTTMAGGIKTVVDTVLNNIPTFTVLGVTLLAFAAATWIANGGLTAMGVAIKGVFLSISTGIKSIPVIGWIIAAVGLLVAALVWFFTKTETGKELWAKIWKGIKDITAGVVDWFMDHVLPVLKAVWDGIAAGAIWLWENGIKPAWDGITYGIGVAVDWIVNVAWPAIKTAWDAIASAAVWLWQSVIMPVWNGIVAAIDFAVMVVTTVINGLVLFFTNILAPVFTFLWNVAQAVWLAIQVAIALAVAIILTIIDGLVWVFQNVLAPVFLWLYNNVIAPVWAGIQLAISMVVDWIVNVAWPMINAVIGFIGTVFSWLYNNVILPVWNGIQIAINAVVVWFQTVAWPVISLVITWISDKFELFKQGLGIIWAFIQNNVINPVVSWFQNTVLPAFTNVLQWIKDKFDLFKAGLDIIFAFVKNNIVQPILDWFNNTVLTTFSNVLGWIKDKFDLWKRGIGVIFDFLKNNIVQPVLDFFSGTVQPMFERVLDGVGKAFNTLKDTVEKVWNGIQDTAKAPIKFVVEDVIRDGIVKNYNRVAGTFGVKQIDEKLFTVGFARGGILPGSSTWRQGDDQLVPMRRGEGVTITEALDPYEKARLLSLNKHVLGGGSARSFRARFGEGHARGGLIGDPLDWIKDVGGFAKDVISDPKGAFNKLADKFLGGVPGGGTIKELAKSVPKKMADMIGDSLFGDGGQVPDSGTVPSTNTGARTFANWQAQYNALKGIASSMGLVMTSNYRGGAKTAGGGYTSLHALGRAVDWSGSASGMSRFFDYIKANYSPTELLYSPKGGGQKNRSSGWHDTSGATKRGHFSHVHLGFAKGGILGQEPVRPYLHDKGGYLQPGLSVLANKTRKPEAVLSDDQWSTAKKAIDNHGGAITINQTISDPGVTSDKIADNVRWELSKNRLRYGN